jgi:hypothetical protein
MRSLRFSGALIAVTVTRDGNAADDAVVALTLLDVSAAGECLKVTAISLFSNRFIDVTFTPLTMLIPTEPYRDEALNMLFAKLIGLKSVPALPLLFPIPIPILLSPIIGCAKVA